MSVNTLKAHLREQKLEQGRSLDMAIARQQEQEEADRQGRMRQAEYEFSMQDKWEKKMVKAIHEAVHSLEPTSCCWTSCGKSHLSVKEEEGQLVMAFRYNTPIPNALNRARICSEHGWLNVFKRVDLISTSDYTGYDRPMLVVHFPTGDVCVPCDQR